MRVRKGHIVQVKGEDIALCSLVEIAFVENRPQSFEDGVKSSRRHLAKVLAALLEKRNGALDAVVRRRLEQEREDLESEELVRDELVREVRDKLCYPETGRLVVSSVPAPNTRVRVTDAHVLVRKSMHFKTL